MVLEWISNGEGLGSCLCLLRVSNRLDVFPELAVGIGKSLVWLLDVHPSESDTKLRLRKTKAYVELASQCYH